MFELYVAGGLITGGDLDSLSLDAVSSVIRRHSSSVVFLRLTLAEPGDLEETVDAVGDYLDLLQRWLQSRAVTLSFMAERGEVVRKMGRDVVEPIDFDDLNREAYLLTNLAIGMDEQVPDDLGFPGVFTWLHEVGGSTADLYDNWRTRGLA